MTTNDSEALSLRLPREDREKLNALVEAKRKELEPLGATISLAQYVRAWIRSSHASMMERQAPAPTPPATVPAAPAAAAPAPTSPAKTTKASPAEADVRRKLKASKRTQAELARATSIDAAMLSRFKAGKKSLSPEKLARLADELG